MKYFTRRLFLDCQGRHDSAATERWKRARTEYEVALRSIEHALPRAAHDITHGTLHDAIIESVEHPRNDFCRILLEGSNSLGPFEVAVLEFTGVSRSNITLDSIGDCWVCEEWALLPTGEFVLSVLLNETEFEVVATGIELRVQA